MIALSDDVMVQIDQLRSRTRRYQRRLWWLLGALGTTGLLIGLMSLLAWLSGPESTLSGVDVPASIREALEALSASDAGNTVGDLSGAMALNDAFEGIGTWLTSWIPAAATILVITSVLTWMTGWLSAVWMMRVVTSAIVLGSSTMMMGMFGVSSPSNSETGNLTPWSRFEALARDGDLVGVQDMLAGIDQASSVPGKYVIAQVALLDEDAEPGAGAPAAHAVSAAGDDHAFDPQVMYAIDMATFGEARSPQAVTYRHDALDSAGTFSAIREGLSIVAVLLGFVSSGLVALRLLLGHRLRRIRSLMGDEETPSREQA